jgi:hypothetical protein
MVDGPDCAEENLLDVVEKAAGRWARRRRMQAQIDRFERKIAILELLACVVMTLGGAYLVAWVLSDYNFSRPVIGIGFGACASKPTRRVTTLSDYAALLWCRALRLIWTRPALMN